MAHPEPNTNFGDAGARKAFAELGRIVLGDQSLNATLQRVAELTKQVLPELSEVSITLMDDEKPRTVVFTGSLAVQLDERQYAAGFGPCTDAAISGETIAVDHTRPDSPYPEFSRAALRAGMTRTVSVGLPIAERTIGAINMYGSTKDALNPSSVELAETFASYAAVAVSNADLYNSTADLARHMQLAMQSRAVIEQAKGIIMGQQRCSSDDAFAILARTSQRRNRKLREVAEDIVSGTQT